MCTYYKNIIIIIIIINITIAIIIIYLCSPKLKLKPESALCAQSCTIPIQCADDVWNVKQYDAIGRIKQYDIEFVTP